MLSITLSALTRVCKGISGGVARIWLYDPKDFTWTQAAPVNNVAQPYTAVALAAGATAAGGAKMFPISFQEGEAEYTFKRTSTACSAVYAHQLEFLVPGVDHTIATYMQQLDAASCCASLGIVIQLFSGKILIAGEQLVDAGAIDLPLKMKHGESTATSGKKLEDTNGATFFLNGNYNRALYEFTGGLNSIIGLE